MIGLWGIGAAAAALSAGLTWFLSSSTVIAVLDHPNARSLHVRPMPRTGGVAVMTSVAASAAVVAALVLDRRSDRFVFAGLIALALALGAISLFEDAAGLSWRIRLACQLILAAAFVQATGAAVTCCGALGSIALGPLGVVITVLGIVWMTNLYNFMDGLDGLAGGMTVIGFGFLAYLGWAAGSRVVPAAASMIAAAAAGFLVFNFPPARIFLGDMGSIPLGFLAGCVSVWGIAEGTLDPALPLILFSPFIVDATATLLKRAVRGERFWEPHRQHWYQRLAIAPWSHRRTVLVEYAFMIASGASAVVYARADRTDAIAVLAGLFALYLIVPLAVRRIERSGSSSASRTEAAR